ncbi:hypothetical protein NC653_027045 [Populus alba x Populus x berolinensis]|uniref:Uncharacterized protein n=1 Tax=Populus alba x Populus x berolinensis TaxID=444605 RepID=A0AAD6M704_9ROSI|nr:hypothetical protein NC653_027045 [Populus alba x Populus x berolinensis]
MLFRMNFRDTCMSVCCAFKKILVRGLHVLGSSNAEKREFNSYPYHRPAFSVGRFADFEANAGNCSVNALTISSISPVDSTTYIFKFCSTRVQLFFFSDSAALSCSASSAFSTTSTAGFSSAMAGERLLLSPRQQGVFGFVDGSKHMYPSTHCFLPIDGISLQLGGTLERALASLQFSYYATSRLFSGSSTWVMNLVTHIYAKNEGLIWMNWPWMVGSVALEDFNLYVFRGSSGHENIPSYALVAQRQTFGNFGRILSRGRFNGADVPTSSNKQRQSICWLQTDHRRLPKLLLR